MVVDLLDPQQKLQRADDAVVQKCSYELVLGGVLFCSAVSSSRFSSSLVSRRSRAVSAFLFKRTPNRWNGDRLKSGGVCAIPQFDGPLGVFRGRGASSRSPRPRRTPIPS